MKRNLVFIFFLCLMGQTVMAQNNPKWLEKAGKSVFSVITYDNEDKILNNGNGFFISEDGVALSDYTTFKGAKRAVVVGSDGKQMPVTSIMGVNDLYDVVKFRVAVSKSVTALTIAQIAPIVGADVYLIPYSTQKNRSCTVGKVTTITKVESKYNYYTLSYPLEDKMVSCPITNAEGEVVALAQKTVGTDNANLSYGLDVVFGKALAIGLLSTSDASLQSIGIKKDLPDDEDKALVFLYMAVSQYTPEAYAELLNDFVTKFPNSSEGYVRRATNYVVTDKDGANIELADNDMNSAIKVAKSRDDALYNRARLIYEYLQLAHDKPYKAWTLEKALADIREAISVNPLPLYTQLEGNILYAQKDFAGALTSYEKVNHSPLVSAATYYNTAMTLIQLKRDNKEVIAVMDSCIAHCPSPITRDMAPYVLERAQVYMDAGMYRFALQDYNTYYDSMNGNVNDVFYYYREQAALKAHQYQLALDDIQAAIDKKSDEMVYRIEQAALNLRLSRIDEAISELKNAMALDSKYAETYRILGLCYIQKKNNAEACANFNKAKELGDPNAQSMLDKYCK